MTSPAAASSPASPEFTDFSDVDAFLRIPRLASVAASDDGRVVAAIQEADDPGAKLVSSLWELDPAGREPARRLTFSAKGESSPRFAPDGSLLFSSARPDPEGGAEEETAAIWRLPRTGEAQVVASAAAGLSLLGVATDGTMLAATSVLPGGTLEDDAERRKTRKDAKQTTIWHTGMPIRLWDHEIGDESRRLV
ncbi:MAG: TolB family protein, partial [Brachybacterium sp.]